jgi:hypothetical protein
MLLVDGKVVNSTRMYPSLDGKPWSGLVDALFLRMRVLKPGEMRGQ